MKKRTTTMPDSDALLFDLGPIPALDIGPVPELNLETPDFGAINRLPHSSTSTVAHPRTQPSRVRPKSRSGSAPTSLRIPDWVIASYREQAAERRIGYQSLMVQHLKEKARAATPKS